MDKSIKQMKSSGMKSTGMRKGMLTGMKKGRYRGMEDQMCPDCKKRPCECKNC
jgi:hypothetical protein